MTCSLTGSWRNQAPADLYRSKWDKLTSIQGRFRDLSTPYLSWVHPDYERADIRLVVVGKETNGWEGHDQIAGTSAEDAVERLMQTYRDFRLGVNYSGKLSFWVPVHELYRRLNPNGATFGFVALNASKMDQDARRPNDQVRDSLTQTGLLREEIRILDPHVVVFHTGPYYEHWLNSWFPGLRRSGDMWFSHLEADGLPRHTFRSYHPQFLNRKSQRGAVYDRVVAAATGQKGS